MKKLTSLQILMLMSLALGSTSMYGRDESMSMLIQKDLNQVLTHESQSAKNEGAMYVKAEPMSMSKQKDLNETVMYELQSAENEEARVDVLTDLAALEPRVVERIVENEADLESSFKSIRSFVHKKNEEIEKLKQESVVSELEIARLAVELTDAQSIFDNTLAKERAHNKRNPKAEQVIKDALMKAKQGLKSLSKKIGNMAYQAQKAVTKSVKHAKKSMQ